MPINLNKLHRQVKKALDKQPKIPKPDKRSKDFLIQPGTTLSKLRSPEESADYASKHRTPPERITDRIFYAGDDNHLTATETKAIADQKLVSRKHFAPLSIHQDKPQVLLDSMSTGKESKSKETIRTWGLTVASVLDLSKDEERVQRVNKGNSLESNASKRLDGENGSENNSIRGLKDKGENGAARCLSQRFKIHRQILSRNGDQLTVLDQGHHLHQVNIGKHLKWCRDKGFSLKKESK